MSDDQPTCAWCRKRRDYIATHPREQTCAESPTGRHTYEPTSTPAGRTIDTILRAYGFHPNATARRWTHTRLPEMTTLQAIQAIRDGTASP